MTLLALAKCFQMGMGLYFANGYYLTDGTLKIPGRSVNDAMYAKTAGS